jgi:glutaredoxin 3
MKTMYVFFFSISLSNIVFASNIEDSCKNKKLYIYTKEYCIYCQMLTKELKNNNLLYEENDITNNFVIHNWLKIKTGSKTVPYVFMDDEYIGGYTDFIALCKNKNIEG